MVVGCPSSTRHRDLALCRDLDRAARFYEEVLGLAVLTSDVRFRAYDVGGRSVLLGFRRGFTLKTVLCRAAPSPRTTARGPYISLLRSGLRNWRRGGAARCAWRGDRGPHQHGRAAVVSVYYPRSGPPSARTGDAGPVGNLLNRLVEIRPVRAESDAVAFTTRDSFAILGPQASAGP